jgi:glycosyltransferase involved in cell wall biosynthesis
MDLSISVVITSYNNGPFIRAAIESVLRQTYPVDQIIITDDCSKDETIRIASEFSKYVTIYTSEFNGGALRNTLRGVNQARGDVICFLDADDVWAPTKTRDVFEAFAGDSELILYSHRHVRIDESGNILAVSDETHKNLQKTHRLSAVQVSDFLRHSVLYRRGYWLGSAYSIRRKAFNLSRLGELLHGKYCSRYSYFDLIAGPFMCATSGGNVGYSDRVGLYYRQHQKGSASSESRQMARVVARRLICTSISTKRVIKSLAIPTLNQRYDYLIRYGLYLRSLADRRHFEALHHLLNLSPSLECTNIAKEWVRYFLSLFGLLFAFKKLRRWKSRFFI